MALLKLKCPECNAGLKSATGFTPGETVHCPKCETYFAVEETDDEGEEEKAKPSKGKDQKKDAPAKKTVKAMAADDDEEEEEEKPKKKKKRAAEDDEERSYKSSPLRFVILGVLVLVMLGLGAALFVKKRNEAAEEKRKDEEAAAEKAREEKPQPQQPLRPGPKVNPKVNTKQGGKGPDVGGFATDALGGLLSGAPASPDKAPGLTQKYTTALVGSWTADLGNGVTEELTYQANGTFTANRTGAGAKTDSGRYKILTLVGTKGLRIQQESTAGAGTRTVTVVFEGDELQHPSLQPGVTAVFRKK